MPKASCTAGCKAPKVATTWLPMIKSACFPGWSHGTLETETSQLQIPNPSSKDSTIPLTSKNFSLRYSGSISTMDVTVLNSFIEAGEYQRIKSGTLQSAKFNIIVNSGHARGTLLAEYKDLTLSKLNKNTGSEKGFLDRISSFFGKMFVIRGTNMPDENGSMKIGETNYTRNPDDYFFQFVWFALRNGVADIVGFPPI